MTHIINQNLQKFYGKTLSMLGNNYVFVMWGLLMHLILLWGILDVNFHSPIIQGLPNVPALKNAPAKRLVLFVADGLRYRTFLESPPKYLKNIMTRKGVWGISHTRMPTESRPGIVAICAGLYEDPSAIFKGWKENPVDFDSVFNQSRFTWSWGSPDIIPIFTKGAKGNIQGDSYPHEWEDFDVMQGQIWRLDSWVFDKYTDWLRDEADKVRNTDGIILFLHLLGCDTTGHAAKPYSSDYVNNMNYVDRKIEELVQMTEKFFQDNRTAYVFTADHGMTDWGSHGSGSTDETETPIIVWGSGVNAHNFQQDVEQVDIAPLMSSLIGTAIPVNSEGILPWQYLNSSEREYRSSALLNNLKQLTYQVKANRAMNCDDNKFADWREVELDKKISELDKPFGTSNAQDKTNETLEALKFAKESLAHFRQYQRFRFLIYLSVMWLGWILLLFFKTVGVRRSTVNSSAILLIDVAFTCLILVIFISHTVSGCGNWRLPCYAFLATISMWPTVRSAVAYSPNLIIRNDKKTWIEIGGTIFLLATMFTGLTYRSAFSVAMLTTAVIQRILLAGAPRLLFWTASCLAIFPLLPVVEPYPRVYVVLLSICVTAVMVAFKVPMQTRYHKAMEVVRLTITGLVYIGFLDGRSWISWAVLITTPLCICVYSTKPESRFQAIVLGLFCPLSLLSASYEPFFFVTLAVNLLCWPQSKIRGGVKKTLTTEELLNATFFMMYTLLCFFGTGNMASISSFDPSWTRHFVTVFSPFVMFSLIFFKISIPLILIGCTSHVFKSPTVFLAVLLLGDCLTLPLMYCVTPHGSWLDIGSAISRFTIAITLPCLLLLLHYLSYPLMVCDLTKFLVRKIEEKKHVV